MMRDTGSIAAPARSLAEIANAWDMVDAKEQRTVAEFRAAKAKLLIEARADPKWGARGDGFVEFVEKRFGIAYPTALRWMTEAGYKPPKKPGAGGNHAQSEHERTPKVDPEEPREIEAQAPRISEADREAAYRREVESSLPPRMEEREKQTHELVTFVSEARSRLREITARNLHLTDVTTSPEDFMRAKQMLIDIVNLCLDELAQAGVLDGKEQRRQMQLLKGGIQ